MDYSLQLRGIEGLGVSLKARLRAMALYSGSMFDCFDSQTELSRVNDEVQASLPEDLDAILMASGDHFSPSTRLDQIAKRVQRRPYPMCHVPCDVVVDYFTKYYTYLAVYAKAKNARVVVSQQP